MENNYLPLYGGDYLRDTTDLSLVEHGAYLLLLIAYWHRGGPLPMTGIYRIVGAIEPEERAAVDSVVQRFFKADGLMLHNQRMDHEIDLRKQFVGKQRAKGIEGAAKRWKNSAPRLAAAKAVAKPNGKARAMANAIAIPPPSPYPSLPLGLDHLELHGTAGAAPSAAAVKIVEKIPLNDGTEFPVTADVVEELGRLYPAVDPEQTLREIRGWNIAHPGERKTQRGVMAHINRWFAKEQNRG